MDNLAAETASQASVVSSLRGSNGDFLTTIQIPEDAPIRSATPEASGLGMLSTELPLSVNDGIIFSFTRQPSDGLDSVSMSTPSPGGDSMSSIFTSPPTPRLTAHELALIGTKHSRSNLQKPNNEATPWFYNALRNKIWRRASNAPTWAQQRNPGRELFIWLVVLLIAVIMLAVVVPVVWVLENDDDNGVSATTSTVMTSPAQILTTSTTDSSDVSTMDITSTSPAPVMTSDYIHVNTTS